MVSAAGRDEGDEGNMQEGKIDRTRGLAALAAPREGLGREAQNSASPALRSGSVGSGSCKTEAAGPAGYPLGVRV